MELSTLGSNRFVLFCCNFKFCPCPWTTPLPMNSLIESPGEQGKELIGQKLAVAPPCNRTSTNNRRAAISQGKRSQGFVSNSLIVQLNSWESPQAVFAAVVCIHSCFSWCCPLYFDFLLCIILVTLFCMLFSALFLLASFARNCLTLLYLKEPMTFGPLRRVVQTFGTELRLLW